MKCSVCGKPGAVPVEVHLSNVLLHFASYCDATCFDQDFDAFSFNTRKAAQCFVRDPSAHAAGDCPCGVVLVK